jgi:hypothetical protein
MMEIDPARRALVRLAREAAMDIHGGIHIKKAINDFIISGRISFPNKYSPKSFYEDLQFIHDSEKYEEAYERYIAHKLNWIPIDQLPMATRGLIQLVRRWLIRTYGGRLPSVHPETKKELRRSPLQKLIKYGHIDFQRSRSYTVEKLFADLEGLMIFHNSNGRIVRKGKISSDFYEAFADYATSLMKWKDITDIPERRRALVSMLRTKKWKLFRGKLPKKLPHYDTYIGNSPLHGILRSGDANLFSDDSLRKTLIQFMRLQRNGMEIVPGSRVPLKFGDAYATFVADVLKWEYPERLSPRTPRLTEILREHAIEQFGGRLPPLHPITKANLATSPIHEILRRGRVTLNKRYLPEKLRSDLVDLLRLDCTGDTPVWGNELPPNFDQTLRELIEYSEGWVIMNDVPEENRELVSAMRDHAFELFGGRLPYDHPLRPSVKLQATTVEMFIKRGSISHHQFAPSRFIRKVMDDFFSLERTGSGEFREIEPSQEIRDIALRYIQPTPLPALQYKIFTGAVQFVNPTRHLCSSLKGRVV